MANSERESINLTAKGLKKWTVIVHRSADLVYKRGVGYTTLDDVLKECQISKSQLYHYFTDKESLVQQIILYREQTILQAQASTLDRLESVEDFHAWCALIAKASELSVNSGCPLGTLASELAHIPTYSSSLDGAFKNWQNLLRDGFRLLIDRNVLRNDTDPSELALSVLCAIQGGLLISRVYQDPEPLKVALSLATDRVMKCSV